MFWNSGGIYVKETDLYTVERFEDTGGLDVKDWGGKNIRIFEVSAPVRNSKGEEKTTCGK